MGNLKTNSGHGSLYPAENASGLMNLPFAQENVASFWVRSMYVVPLKQIGYGVCADLITVYTKQYSIYYKGDQNPNMDPIII